METRSFSVEKSCDLIAAVHENKINKVQRLVRIFSPEINFNYYFNDSESNNHFSALSTALMRQNAEMAFFLIENGARCDIPPDILYVETSHYTSLLFIMLEWERPDLALFKKLLRLSTEICHENILGESIAQCIYKAKSCPSQLASLYLHEAILRGSRRAINQVLDAHCEFVLTPATFMEYLGDITLTQDQILKIKPELDYLEEKEVLSHSSISQMTNFISLVPIISDTPKYHFSIVSMQNDIKDLQAQLKFLMNRFSPIQRDDERSRETSSSSFFPTPRRGNPFSD